MAFASNLEAVALDDALDLLDILITEIFSDAARASDKGRLRTIKDLDAAAIQLMQVCRLILDPDSGHQSLLDRLRKGPYRRSAPELVRALDRVEEVRRLEITLSIANRIPTGAATCAGAICRHRQDQRYS